MVRDRRLESVEGHLAAVYQMAAGRKAVVAQTIIAVGGSVVAIAAALTIRDGKIDLQGAAMVLVPLLISIVSAGDVLRQQGELEHLLLSAQDMANLLRIRYRAD